MGFLEGTKSRPLESAGDPTLGVDEAQSINVSAAPSTGTFVLVFEGFRTTPIAFNANAAAVQAAMEALPSVGSGNIVGSGGPIGATLILTFVLNLGKKAITTLISEDVALNTMDNNALIIVAETVVGVDAFRRGSGKGALAIDVTNGVEYINTGTDLAPTWTVVGTQT